jgi:hypothetical protein
MNRPTQYKVITEYYLTDLVKTVNREIKVGWIPQGSVYFDSGKWYQAMCAYNVLGPYITRIAEDGTRVEISEGSNSG